jgi:hypothetical protein
MGCLAGAGLARAVVGAQQNSVHPQPRAEELPRPSMAAANPNRRVPQPEGTLPKVPAGFSVASYAELRGPRMMVYAPNGDLFVSSPSTNSIFVLRDANNDGVFEARGVFAEECAPRLGRRAAVPDHILRDGALRDIKAPAARTLQHLYLMAQGQYLDMRRGARPQPSSKRCQEGDAHGSHRGESRPVGGRNFNGCSRIGVFQQAHTGSHRSIRSHCSDGHGRVPFSSL